jgi:hypothetical protein
MYVKLKRNFAITKFCRNFAKVRNFAEFREISSTFHESSYIEIPYPPVVQYIKL